MHCVDAAKGFASEDEDSECASPKKDAGLLVLVNQTGILCEPVHEFANAEPCVVNAQKAEEGLA